MHSFYALLLLVRPKMEMYVGLMLIRGKLRIYININIIFITVMERANVPDHLVCKTCCSQRPLQMQLRVSMNKQLQTYWDRSRGNQVQCKQRRRTQDRNPQNVKEGQP